MRWTLTTILVAAALAGTAWTYAMQEAATPPSPTAATTGSDHGLLGDARRAASEAYDHTEGLCFAVTGTAGLDGHDCDPQADGGEAGDASDDCAEPHPPIARGTRTNGLLPPTDPGDHFALMVDQLDLDRTIEVAVYANGSVALEPVHRFHVVVHGPGCAYQVEVGESYGYASVARFVAEDVGVYTLQVVQAPPDSAGANATDVLAPRPSRCHPHCMQGLNEEGGYGLKVE